MLNRLKRAWRAFMAPEADAAFMVKHITESVAANIESARFTGGPFRYRGPWGSDGGPETITPPKDKP